MPIESFDRVVTDECHRSIYGTRRQVLDDCEPASVLLERLVLERPLRHRHCGAGGPVMISSAVSDILEAGMQVSKWGNSLAVRLLKKLVEDLQLAPGDELAVVAATKDEITVEKIDRRAAFLKAMEQFRWPAPEGYKFDRNEANER